MPDVTGGYGGFSDLIGFFVNFNKTLKITICNLLLLPKSSFYKKAIL